MIHLFRKIRFSNLKSSQFKKYIFYAFGEIILVVIGILLALQFNNWNIKKENDKKERWYLINIVEDIEYQKGDLKEQKRIYEANINIAKTILKEFNATNDFSKIDSLNQKLNLLMVSDNFPNINNTYQELVSSGQQNIISDKDLSIDIIDYYLFCNDNFMDTKNDNDNIFYKEIHPVFYSLSETELTDFEISTNEQHLKKENKIANQYIIKKLQSPEQILLLINALKTTIIVHTEHVEMITETLSAGVELTQQIDDYLGLTPDMVNHYD